MQLFLATTFVSSVWHLGTYSSRLELASLYRELFEKYREEALKPKYDNLKIKPGDNVVDVKKRSETSLSNFDKLKEIVQKNQ